MEKKSLLLFVFTLLIINPFTVIKGQTWELVSETENAQRLLAISFPDSLHGWMVGNKPGDNRGYIIHTDDGGKTWNEQTSSVSDQLQDVHFMDQNTGFALGVNSIQKTVNGGTEWTNIELDSLSQNPYFADFDFVESSAFAVGDNGTILKSTNGGDDWMELSQLPSGAFYLAVDFANPDTGIVVGGMGTDHYAIRTVDGGETWDSLAIETSVETTNGSFNDINFVDDSTVYIVGRAGKVVRSNDYGTTWQEKTRIDIISGNILDNTSLYFQDKDTGWVASALLSSQAVMINRTNDGGDTWTEELFFTQSPVVGLEDIIFTENGIGWACGNQSGLTLNGELIFRGTSEINTSIDLLHKGASKISLFQNYPNPFGSATEIMLELNKSADIKLKICTATGQVVGNLYNGMLSPGKHSFIFDAKSLPGGVYISVLQVDGVSLSRKILLTR